MNEVIKLRNQLLKATIFKDNHNAALLNYSFDESYLQQNSDFQFNSKLLNNDDSSINKNISKSTQDNSIDNYFKDIESAIEASSIFFYLYYYYLIFYLMQYILKHENI